MIGEMKSFITCRERTTLCVLSVLRCFIIVMMMMRMEEEEEEEEEEEKHRTEPGVWAV